MPRIFANYVPSDSRAVAEAAVPIGDKGVTILTGTSTRPVYTLSGPSAVGNVKYLIVTPNSTIATATVNFSSTGVGVYSTTTHLITNNQLSFSGFSDAVQLISTSTAQWLILSNVGTVATGTQST